MFFRLSVCLFACLSLLVCQPAKASEEGPRKIQTAAIRFRAEEDPNNLPLDRKTCGVDSLFVMLTLCNVDATFEAVKSEVAVGESGSSLSDLGLAASRLGLNLSAVQVEPESLTSLEMPSLALVENPMNLAIRHYVVILKITDKVVVYFDPEPCAVNTITLSQYLRVSTGYYLVRTPHSYLPGVSAGFLLVGAAFAVTFWRMRKPECVAAIVAFIFVAGCQKEQAQGPSAPPSKPRALLVPHTSVDLGRLDESSEREGRFTFRNVSSVPIRLKLMQPSCNCLGLTLTPADGHLAPGQEGSLALKLNYKERKEGGVFGADVVLMVDGSDEHYIFAVSGLKEGMLTQAPYVLRPENLRTRTAPTFRISFVASGRDFLPEIMSIIPIRMKNGVEQKLPEVTPSPSGEYKIGEVRLSSESRYYVRAVEIPIKLEELSESFAGEFRVTYRQNGRTNIGVVKMLVVADDSF